MKKIAVVGAGIIGICSSYFLQQSGFKVTLIDKEQPGTMTSYGHACTFADYANVPVNDAYIPLDGKLVLETNDSFTASAGAGTTLKILLSVLETAN